MLQIRKKTPLAPAGVTSVAPPSGIVSKQKTIIVSDDHRLAITAAGAVTITDATAFGDSFNKYVVGRRLLGIRGEILAGGQVAAVPADMEAVQLSVRSLRLTLQLDSSVVILKMPIGSLCATPGDGIGTFYRFPEPIDIESSVLTSLDANADALLSVTSQAMNVRVMWHLIFES